jgi:hypothetical protein
MRSSSQGPVQSVRMPSGLTHLGGAPPSPSYGAPSRPGGAPSQHRSVSQAASMKSSQEVMGFLQGLSPDELNAVEAAFRAEKAAAGAAGGRVGGPGSPGPR